MGKWTISAFNGVFFVCFGLFLLALVLSSILLRKKSDKVRRIVLASAMIFTCVVFVFYKIALSLDRAYSEILISENQAAFSWWTELPLQLCNINMILIPIAVLTDNKGLMGFSFFIGPIGALLALIMPVAGFSGYSIFLPRNLGYYFTHFMVFIGCIALASYGFFKPEFKNIIPVILTFFIVTAVIFLVNMVLRWTGLAPRANYFYLVETAGNPLLEVFHSWIPYPFLYLLPALPIIVLPYMLIETAIFTLIGKRKKNAAETA